MESAYTTLIDSAFYFAVGCGLLVAGWLLFDLIDAVRCRRGLPVEGGER